MEPEGDRKQSDLTVSLPADAESGRAVARGPPKDSA